MYFLRFLTRRNYIQRHSLRVYTSTPRCQHVLESNMNGGAAILDKATLALPLPLNLLLWLSAWVRVKYDVSMLSAVRFALFCSI